MGKQRASWRLSDLYGTKATSFFGTQPLCVRGVGNFQPVVFAIQHEQFGSVVGGEGAWEKLRGGPSRTTASGT